MRNNKNIQKEISEEMLQSIAEVLNSLAHPLRLKIILYLYEHPASVSEMLQILNVRQPNLSQHLNLLKRLKILKTKRQGRMIYYHLNCPELRDYIINIIELLNKLKLIV
ncbi:MAG: metalloregulator ArsR/SmtB family transcription factor [Dictyoglomus sp.]|nr:metalloregulator ArsR/SmtB family transcription factor [Dictyoglomus sp.]MCX7941598.1 metalloregulator ArsR/SmtB family transcription factor [Dictyoglomaceae bacterium]MDW8187783.1 metalloregulator ArsR/SmtB family transcription factor [Dictyoglomus sp.]